MEQLFFHFFKNKITSKVLYFTLCLALFGCLPSSYPEPELQLFSTLPDENHRITIADIKSLYPQNPSFITDNLYCVATVVGNDIEGNFYKELYLQDSTGGLLLKNELSKVSEKFGEGRKVVIKLQNLAFSVENNMPVLGKLNGTKTLSLLITSIDSFITRTTFYENPTVKKIDPDVLPDNQLLGTSVILQGVLFKDGGEKISETTVKNNQNFTLELTNSPIFIRVSPYCNFVERRLPATNQKCHIKGVLSRYNNQWYLIIADFKDIIISE